MSDEMKKYDPAEEAAVDNIPEAAEPVADAPSVSEPAAADAPAVKKKPFGIFAIVGVAVVAIVVALVLIIGGGKNPPDNTPSDGETSDNTPPVHVHEFIPLEIKEVTCEEDGKETLQCACGETQENVYTALGHDMQPNGGIEASCTRNGMNYFKCANCGKSTSEVVKKLGHEFGDPVEASRFSYCTREGCSMSEPAFPKSGKYTDTLSFTFGDADKEALDAKHNEILAILEAAEAYDADKHAYAESGALADEYAAAEVIYEEYSDLIYLARDQYSIAMTFYYCDKPGQDYETIYDEMSEFYTDLVSKYYSLSQPWYDSKYRDFFFYGATEDEIKAFLADSNAYANPEYAQLQARNTEIEIAFNNIEDTATDPLVCTLFYEVVQNNKRIAEILGYDNYLEYAYENVYDREYTYLDVAQFTEYVVTYMAPIYNKVLAEHIANMSNGASYTQKQIDEFYAVVSESFFTNVKSNVLFNDYIDMMEMAFTSNPDKLYSFSDALNDLCVDGNLFRGKKDSAYVTYLYGNKIPVVYFGAGYDSPVTVSHEFGHYMNEIYNQSEYNQSYDLLETHSQGNEMLFIYFVKDYVSSTAYKLSETYQMYSTLASVISALRVDAFEQAIYLDSYDGYFADIIMADGVISADEYDLLYESIGKDFGLNDGADDLKYWRYGMTISSPCYYVSYSVSAINSLQLYAKIYSDGFDAAKDSYLKLFTYTDVDPEMDMDEVLEYAGLKSYTSEDLYKELYNMFMNR